MLICFSLSLILKLQDYRLRLFTRVINEHFFFNQNKAKWINKWTELLAGDTNLATVPSCQKISINGWTRKHSIHRSRINKCCRHFRQVIFLLDNYTRAKTFSAVFVSSLMKTWHWSLIILWFYRLPSNELTRLRRPEFYKALWICSFIRDTKESTILLLSKKKFRQPVSQMRVLIRLDNSR